MYKRILALVLSLIMVVSAFGGTLSAFAGVADGTTNVVTLKSDGAVQSNQTKLTYSSSSNLNQTAKNAMGGDAWTYANLTTASNVTMAGWQGTTSRNPITTSDAKLGDGVLNSCVDSGFGWADSWNYSNYANNGYPEKYYTLDGATYYISDWTGEAYIDYTINLGGNYDIKGLLITATENRWKIGSYEIYVSDNKANLYQTVPVATYAIDESLWFNNSGNNGTPPAAISNNVVDIWKTIDGVQITGKFVGVRVKQICVGYTEEKESNHLKTTLRMAELAVYGEPHVMGDHDCVYTNYAYNETHYWMACECGAAGEKHLYGDDDFTATSGAATVEDYKKEHKLAESIIADQHFSAFALNTEYSQLQKRTRLNVWTNGSQLNYSSPIREEGTQWNKQGLTDPNVSREVEIGGDFIDFGVFEGGTSASNLVGVFTDETKKYVDICYPFDDTYTISKISFYSHPSAHISVHKYKVSFANSMDDLFTEKAVATSGILTNFGNSATIVPNIDIKATYFGIRIITSIQPTLGQPLAKGSNYIRMHNISVFTSDEHKCTFGDYVSDGLKHWKQCKKCGAKTEEANHDFGTTKYDTVYHWRECVCGSRSGTTEHTLVDTKDGKACECGYTISSTTNSVTLTENGTVQTNSSVITYESSKNTSKTPEQLMGSGWNYKNFATGTSISFDGYSQGTAVSVEKPDFNKLTDGDLKVHGDSGWKFTDYWNGMGYPGQQGYPENKITIDGTEYYYSDNSGAAYIDIIVSLGSIQELRGILISAGPDGGYKWKIGSYELYVGQDKTTLFKKAPFATYEINQELWYDNSNNGGTAPTQLADNYIDIWKVPEGSMLAGNYVGIRIKQMCVSMTKEKGLNYLKSTLRLSEIAVFGEEACGGNHDFDSETIREGTCTVDGVYQLTCKNCGYERRSEKAPLGHTFSNYDTYVEADCVNDAYYLAVCDREGCTVTDKKKVEGTAKGHKYVSTPTVKPSGKNAGGFGGSHCQYCGEIKVKETIVYAIKSVKLSTTEYEYNGKTRKPSVTVTDIKGKKVSSDLYKVTYASGRKNVGKYKVTVSFKNSYAPSVNLYFTINPVKTSIKSISAGSKKLTVKWSKKSSQVTGYEIQYSTSSKFSSKYTKKTTVSSYKTTSKTIKSLKAKKKYYVRVRTYKTVSGKKYYSDWSSKKSTTTKK